MNAEMSRYAPCCCTFRWAGRAGTILLFGAWLIAFLFEPTDFATVFPAAIYWQLAMLMVLFTGYGVGWFRERLGGIVSLAGFAGYFLSVWISALSFGIISDRELSGSLLVYAAPGILFLISWWLDTSESANGGTGHEKDMRPAMM